MSIIRTVIPWLSGFDGPRFTLVAHGLVCRYAYVDGFSLGGTRGIFGWVGSGGAGGSRADAGSLAIVLGGVSYVHSGWLVVSKLGRSISVRVG